MLLSEPRDRNLTFAEPGEGRGFAETLADVAGPRDGAFLTPAQIAEREGQMSRLFDAAANAQRLTGLMSSKTEALADAAENRIGIIRDQTGVTLENPFRQGYFNEARQRVQDAQRRGEKIDNPSQRAVEEQVNIFNEKLDALAETNPEKAKALSFLQPLSEQAQAIANNAEDELANASGNAPGPGQKLFGIIPTNPAYWSSTLPTTLAAGIWGSRRDPLSVVSMFAGPASTTAKTALGRIFFSGVRDSAFNAGVQLIAEPDVQQWRAERGKEYGIVPAAEDVAWAAALGFIPGATIRGAIEARPSLTRIMEGAPEKGDFTAAAKALDFKLDKDTRATVQAAERTIAADDAMSQEVPPGVAPDVHADAAKDAARFYEGPPDAVPPELPVPRFAETEGEHIVRPAVIAGDVVYDAATHAEALARAEARGAPPGASEPGFLTSEGRFVTGAEAEALDPSARPMLEKLDRLSPEARQLVDDRTVPVEHAAAIADVPMPLEHQAGVLREVSARQPEDAAAARSMAADQVERIGQKAERARLDRETGPLVLEGEPRQRSDETVIERAGLEALDPTAPANKIRSAKTDAIEAIPLTRDDGSLVMVKPEAVNAAGARDRMLSDLIGACR